MKKSAHGRLIKLSWYTRELAVNHPDILFMFGDNLARRGYRGQAAEMRGEQNAIGVPTKRKPSAEPDAFFTDDDLSSHAFRHVLRAPFIIAQHRLISGCDVVIPAAGFGTGFARLSTNAPAVLEFIEKRIARLERVASKVVETI